MNIQQMAHLCKPLLPIPKRKYAAAQNFPLNTFTSDMRRDIGIIVTPNFVGTGRILIQRNFRSDITVRLEKFFPEYPHANVLRDEVERTMQLTDFTDRNWRVFRMVSKSSERNNLELVDHIEDIAFLVDCSRGEATSVSLRLLKIFLDGCCTTLVIGGRDNLSAIQFQCQGQVVGILMPLRIPILEAKRDMSLFVDLACRWL